MSTAPWRVTVPTALLCLALTLAGCGGSERPAGDGGSPGLGSRVGSQESGQGGSAGTAPSVPPFMGLSPDEIDELEKAVSDAEGAADQAEREIAEP
jgi:hypothetical protein